MSAGQYGAPIVFRGPTGNAGMLGAQHSQNFENWYANTPGLKVVVPSNPYYGKGLLKSSIRDNDPVIFMESELMYSDKGQVPEEEYLVPIGKAYVVREGTDVTIVSFGKMMKVAFGAAQELEKEGVSAEVIDLCTVRPIDYATVVESVKKTNRLVMWKKPGRWPRFRRNWPTTCSATPSTTSTPPCAASTAWTCPCPTPHADRSHPAQRETDAGSRKQRDVSVITALFDRLAPGTANAGGFRLYSRITKEKESLS
jgi:pyruvate/2-oxoglutarate/acetoin dehydrogenase E1 component